MQSSPERGPVTFTLVTALKFTDAGAYAFEESVRIAQRLPGCALHLLHVIEESPSEAKTRDLAGHLRLYANDKVRSLGGLSGITVGIHVRAGKPVEEIARFTAETGADLLVLGAHEGLRMSWYRRPTIEQVLGAAACPVVVAGPKPPAPADGVPAIEPPCPDCVRARAASNGREWWCARHAAHGARAHTFSYQRELPLRLHDSEVIPTGIDM